MLAACEHCNCSRPNASTPCCSPQPTCCCIHLDVCVGYCGSKSTLCSFASLLQRILGQVLRWHVRSNECLNWNGRLQEHTFSTDTSDATSNIAYHINLEVCWCIKWRLAALSEIQHHHHQLRAVAATQAQRVLVVLSLLQLVSLHGQGLRSNIVKHSQT